MEIDSVLKRALKILEISTICTSGGAEADAAAVAQASGNTASVGEGRVAACGDTVGAAAGGKVAEQGR